MRHVGGQSEVNSGVILGQFWVDSRSILSKTGPKLSKTGPKTSKTETKPSQTAV